MKRYEQISAFILCGGASSRMGQPKGLLDFGGEPLLIRIARLVEPLVSAIMAVGTHSQYADLGLPLIEDAEFAGSQERHGKAGPLAGIATALTASRSEWNLIVGCDLPYLTREWLNWLLGYVMGIDAQILIPKTAGGLEPLAAVYRKECADPLIEALRRGTRKVTDAIAPLRLQVIREMQWQHIDCDRRVLRNMNTPQDYEEARMWLQRPRS
jgi:molybdopterin-guanine dinucleotide biosynthesis protein A